MKLEDRYGHEIVVGSSIAWPVVRNQTAEMRSGVVESILVTEGPHIRLRVRLDKKSRQSYRNKWSYAWGYCRRLDQAIVLNEAVDSLQKELRCALCVANELA